MFKKKKDYFFSSFNELFNYVTLAYQKLKTGLINFNKTNSFNLKNEVHEVEHNGDLKKHEIEEKLAKEFITPIDREDIFMLLDKIDDLIDCIDEISYKLFIRNYDKLPSNLDIFIQKGEESVLALKDVILSLDNPLDKIKLDPLIYKVLNLEEEMDHLYEDNIRNLYSANTSNYLELVKQEKLFSYFENVSDKCRDVIKVIQIIIYKNL